MRFFLFFLASCALFYGSCSEPVKQRVMNREHQDLFNTWWDFDPNFNPDGTRLMDVYFSTDGQYQSSGGEQGSWKWTVENTMTIQTHSKTWVVEFTKIDSNEMHCLFGEEKREYRFSKRKKSKQTDNGAS